MTQLEIDMVITGVFAVVPVDEIDHIENVVCSSCMAQLDDEAMFDGCLSYYCEHCAESLENSALDAARRFAAENCRITKPIPDYDPTQEFRCSPEDYANGIRDSYSPNAFLAHCRHNCTNYDAIVATLSRDWYRDKIAYLAIRDEVDRQLMSRLEESGSRVLSRIES